MCYKGTKFHRISKVLLHQSIFTCTQVLTTSPMSTFTKSVPNFMIQGGDISDSNGVGGESIYGGYFDDEQSEVRKCKRD